MNFFVFRFLCILFVFVGNSFAEDGQEPVPQSELEGIRARYGVQEKTMSARLKQNPKEISSYSSRGDARLFLADFKGARADYEKMIEACMKEAGMTYEDSVEWIEFNTISAYVGRNTPIYVNRYEIS